MAFGIGLTPAQIARKDREYRSSQGSPFANSARYRNPHPPLSLTNKGRGHSKSNVKMYKLQSQAGSLCHDYAWMRRLNFASVTSPVTSSKTTSTGKPMRN